MVKRKSARDREDGEKLLTETELEIMTVLWKIGEGSVNEVLEVLSKERELAYTSVSTILRILEQKKAVGSRKEGRGHIYIPLIAKDHYEATSLKHLVTKVFDRTPSALVKRLLDSSEISAEELESIRELLRARTES